MNSPAPQGISLTWLGHSTVRIEMDGLVLLTDPLVRRHTGLLRRVGPAPTPALWTGVDAILLSHLHLDHADVPSLRRVGGASAGALVVTGAANASWVTSATALPTLSPTDWRPLPGRAGTEVRLVRADHHHRPMPHRPNDAHGMLVRGPSGVLWFAGDTSLYAEMADLAALAEAPVDVAIVPVGGWGPRLGAGHLDPAEAAAAVRISGARSCLPVHSGTLHPLGLGARDLGWMHRPRQEFAQRLAQDSPGVLNLDPARLSPGATGGPRASAR